MVQRGRQETGERDVEQVLEVVSAFDSALDTGDLVAAASLCLDDFLFHGSGEGEVCLGAANLAATFARARAAAGTELVGWNLSLAPYDVVVRGDTARVTANGRFELATRSGTRSGTYVLTGTLLRTDAGWRWWCFHGSEPQPWAP